MPRFALLLSEPVRVKAVIFIADVGFAVVLPHYQLSIQGRRAWSIHKFPGSRLQVL